MRRTKNVVAASLAAGVGLALVGCGPNNAPSTQEATSTTSGSRAVAVGCAKFALTAAQLRQPVDKVFDNVFDGLVDAQNQCIKHLITDKSFKNAVTDETYRPSQKDGGTGATVHGVTIGDVNDEAATLYYYPKDAYPKGATPNDQVTLAAGEKAISLGYSDLYNPAYPDQAAQSTDTEVFIGRKETGEFEIFWDEQDNRKYDGTPSEETLIGATSTGDVISGSLDHRKTQHDSEKAACITYSLIGEYNTNFSLLSVLGGELLGDYSPPLAPTC